MNQKQCKRCGKMFPKDQVGRVRITIKERVGEKVAWLCVDCSGLSMMLKEMVQ